MLRKVVEVEGLTTLTGGCRAAVWSPARFGLDPLGIDVAIPPAVSPRKPPRTTTARAINQRFIRAHRAPPEHPLFTESELATMTGSTFAAPAIRYGYVHDDPRRKTGLLTMVVVYSPESAKTFVFEQRYLDRSEVDLATRDARIRRDVDTFLRGLGLTSVRFPVELACEIPEELGGRQWYPVRIDP